MIGLLAASLTLMSSPIDDPVPAATAARAGLKGCGPVAEALARLPDSSWAPQPSRLPEHRALRSALNAPMPEAPTQIRFYATGGHLADYWYSIVLTRDAAGLWSGTEVGRSRLWGKDAPIQPTSRRAWTLSIEDGGAVDSILADPCFYAEPTSGWYDPAGGPPPPSVFTITFETITPERSRQTHFPGGTAKGRTADLFALILPKHTG